MLSDLITPQIGPHNRQNATNGAPLDVIAALAEALSILQGFGWGLAVYADGDGAALGDGEMVFFGGVRESRDRRGRGREVKERRGVGEKERG